jgi:hypothetical protein
MELAHELCQAFIAYVSWLSQHQRKRTAKPAALEERGQATAKISFFFA